MPATVPQNAGLDLRNSFPSPRMAKAKLDVNFVQNASQLLRAAIARSGLSQKEAMSALGVDHPGRFSEMLDGKQKLWVHALLRPEARAIWLALIILSAKECHCEIEHVIKIKESA